ncbi:MAG: hypothetical protein ABN478_07405, partial [Mixta sp.]
LRHNILHLIHHVSSFFLRHKPGTACAESQTWRKSKIKAKPERADNPPGRINPIYFLFRRQADNICLVN